MPCKHHDFNKAVGYALISPESDWPRRKGPPEISSQKKRKRSPTAAEQTGGATKAPRFHWNALCPSSGSLRCRLDETQNHMPIEPSVKPDNRVCQLHRWAAQTKGMNIPPGARGSSVCQCKHCGVNLCIRCFETYHTCWFLESKIDDILRKS